MRRTFSHSKSISSNGLQQSFVLFCKTKGSILKKMGAVFRPPSATPTPCVHVYFATARWRRNGHRARLSRRFAITRRRPRWVWYWSLAAMTRTLSRSSLAHVAIGDDDVVLDPALQGDRVWPRLAFEQHFPTLAARFTLPAAQGFAIHDRHVDLRRKRVVPSLARLASRGRWPAHNCVSEVINVLREAGVAVPPRTVSPIQLYAHLLRMHHARLSFFSERVAKQVTGHDADADRSADA